MGKLRVRAMCRIRVRVTVKVMLGMHGLYWQSVVYTGNYPWIAQYCTVQCPDLHFAPNIYFKKKS